MIKYRSDIDGLRAIAVLAVLFYHAKLGVSGGFVGVDIFFVISGYLITKIIVQDLEKKSFSIIDFWERRIRRIFPALLAVVLATVIFGFIVQFPKEYQSLSCSVMWIAGLSSNIYFWRNTGDYFDGPIEEIPLLHTWSLSLEEQFYVVVPVLLLFIFRYLHRSFIVKFFLIMILISFIFSIWGVKQYPIATFYLLPTRAWELAAGSLLVFAAPLQNTKIIKILSSLGILFIFLPIFFYTSEIRFPGYMALPPVVGACLIIWTGIDKADIKKVSLIHKLLSIKPLVWIGLLSYSLYLWHWPLLAYYKYLSVKEDSIFQRVALMGVAIIIAAISLYLVERPVRTKKILKSRIGLFSSSSLAIALLFLFALKKNTDDGVTRFNKNIKLTSLPELTDTQKIRHEVAVFPPNFGFLGADNKQIKVLFLGDSHCGALAPMLNLKLQEDAIGGRYISTSGDPLLNGFKKRSGDINLVNRIIEHIRSDDSFKYLRDIVLIARWQYYMYHESEFFVNKSFEVSLEETVKEYKKLKCNIHLMIQVPEFSDTPKLHVRSSWPFNFNFKTFNWEGNYPEFSKIKIANNYQKQISIFENLSIDCNDVKILNPLPLMLSKKQKYQMFKNNIPLYSDHNHLSVEGSTNIQSLFSFQ